jgi:DNA polymerase
MNNSALSLSAEIDAALDWWRRAGVDCDFAREPQDWLAEDIAIQAAKPAGRAAAVEQPEDPPRSAPARMDLFAGAPPGDLRAFREWWLTAPGLDAIGPRGRVAPRGDAGADLLVLVPEPEDSDDERLLSGPQGRLLTGFMRAARVDEDAVYIASALPRHTPMADMANFARSGFDAVTARHLALAAPKRLLVLGAGVAPFLGLTPDVGPGEAAPFDAGEARIPCLMAEGLDAMLAMPGLKARFWRRWLAWSRP